jgi:hypothetical protein
MTDAYLLGTRGYSQAIGCIGAGNVAVNAIEASAGCPVEADRSIWPTLERKWQSNIDHSYYIA